MADEPVSWLQRPPAGPHSLLNINAAHLKALLLCQLLSTLRIFRLSSVKNISGSCIRQALRCNICCLRAALVRCTMHIKPAHFRVLSCVRPTIRALLANRLASCIALSRARRADSLTTVPWSQLADGCSVVGRQCIVCRARVVAAVAHASAR